MLDASLFAPARGERCRLSECRAGCCRNGAWMSPAHAGRILSEADAVARALPEARRDPAGWFDEENEDPDFEEGYAVGTAAVEDPDEPGASACVFLRPDRLCALQVAGEGLALPPPGLKPFHCALYPLLLSQGELLFDRWSPDELDGADCQRRATGPSRAVFEVFRDEVVLALGEEGWAEVARVGQSLE